MNRPGLLEQISETFRVHPVCALLGPRQAGKTTLAKMFAEQNFQDNVHFFDLENPADITRLENPLLAFSQTKKKLIVIDEVQLRPDLFSILRVIVDSSTDHLFLILGSASRELIKQSSQSLAGRIGYINVMPFSLEETNNSAMLWFRGGFPRSYLANNTSESNLWRKNYIKTFLEQDIPALGFQVPPAQLRKFWLMIAHYHGQILNSSELGRSLGVTHHTIRNYLDILSGTFMIHLLEPWFENLQKRQVRTPKIYFRDSGLLHTLLNLETPEQLYEHPKVGASWEGFALEQIIRFSKVDSGECFFWATHSEAELDLFITKRGKRIGFEFKYADNPTPTKSMHVAITDLKLDKLYIVVPNDKKYQLTEKIHLCGIDAIKTIDHF